jgi:pSer/pThr/pTyr-binding forkhead associated (FHA) protein/CheY-like chemotaxis protein
VTDAEEAQLVVVEGPDRGRRYALRGTVVIGRGEEAQIFIDDAEVSRQHARIARSEDGFVVEDLCSRNGTAVAGRRIAVPTLLCYGDCIRLGNHVELLFTERRRREDPAPHRRRETLDRLSASAAHDLKNKLAAARASLDFLRDLPRKSELGAGEVQECLADLALSLGESVDLLPWLQPSAEPRSDRDGVVDVSRIVADLAAYLGQSFGADLVASRVEAELTVKGDSTALYQAFLELAIRAREAPSCHGRLFLAARKKPLSRFDRRRGRVFVTIRGGAGSDDDTLGEPLREPPWLAPITGVIAQHGGRLRTSDAGGLWSFEIDLAVHDAPSAHGSANPSPPSSRPRTGRGPVLVVHDERVLRNALTRVLVGAGIEVIEVGTHEALEALQGATKRIPVAVVEDGPGPEGGSLVDALTARGGGVRLVVMKGRGPASGRASSRHLLPEPWTAETILTAVERFLDAG